MRPCQEDVHDHNDSTMSDLPDILQRLYDGLSVEKLNGTANNVLSELSFAQTDVVGSHSSDKLWASGDARLGD